MGDSSLESQVELTDQAHTNTKRTWPTRNNPTPVPSPKSTSSSETVSSSPRPTSSSSENSPKMATLASPSGGPPTVSSTPVTPSRSTSTPLSGTSSSGRACSASRSRSSGPTTLYPDIITIMEPKEEKRPEADKGKTV